MASPAIVDPSIVRALRWLLTFELFLGGQARLTSVLTPALHRKAMSKKVGTQRHLPLIPIKDAEQHTRVVGFLMCAAGALLTRPQTRLAGGCLSIFLTLSGVYTQYRMQIPYWLPTVNTVISAVLIGHERGLV